MNFEEFTKQGRVAEKLNSRTSEVVRGSCRGSEFFLFEEAKHRWIVLLAVWFTEKGSNESKNNGEEHRTKYGNACHLRKSNPASGTEVALLRVIFSAFQQGSIKFIENAQSFQ